VCRRPAAAATPLPAGQHGGVTPVRVGPGAHVCVEAAPALLAPAPLPAVWQQRHLRCRRRRRRFSRQRLCQGRPGHPLAPDGREQLEHVETAASDKPGRPRRNSRRRARLLRFDVLQGLHQLGVPCASTGLGPPLLKLAEVHLPGAVRIHPSHGVVQLRLWETREILTIP
jgi:hypothetical protein